MVTLSLDQASGVLLLHPAGPLTAEDFTQIAATADPFIESNGSLKAVVIEAAHFPGWENFGAAASHFRFIRDHHQKIRKVAIVTDSPLGAAAEHLGSHFVAAEIKHFPSSRSSEAKAWASA
ncbi:MAG: STAS/SEC14 domain-containing protein [Chthoniobacterales bacterium]|nr:STAS/SEC14 domain-containing protein [Chthoniobacterales bacterium]